jgi:hypothetical protein
MPQRDPSPGTWRAKAGRAEALAEGDGASIERRHVPKGSRVTLDPARGAGTFTAVVVLGGRLVTQGVDARILEPGDTLAAPSTAAPMVLEALEASVLLHVYGSERP